jgi:hypothetical protein
MYNLLRSTHLFLGLFLCLFVLTYEASSVMLAQPSWFSPTPKITEQEIIISPEIP